MNQWVMSHRFIEGYRDPAYLYLDTMSSGLMFCYEEGNVCILVFEIDMWFWDVLGMSHNQTKRLSTATLDLEHPLVE